jgi:hypothetical protein
MRYEAGVSSPITDEIHWTGDIIEAETAAQAEDAFNLYVRCVDLCRPLRYNGNLCDDFLAEHAEMQPPITIWRRLCRLLIRLLSR